jgi:hypothetical protein
VCDARTAREITAVLLTSPAARAAVETALVELLWMACRDEPLHAIGWRDAIRAVGMRGEVRDPTDAVDDVR